MAGKKDRKPSLNFATTNELENTLRSALKELRRYKGGNVLFSIEPTFIMDIELLSLCYLLKKEMLDGVAVNLTRPHYFVHRALMNDIGDDSMLMYVDPIYSIAGSLMGPPELENKVFIVDGPFEVDRIAAAVDKAVQYAASHFDGDEHFVYIDNLASLMPYVDMKDIISFAKKVFKGYKGSFVYKFAGLGHMNNDTYKKLFSKLKGQSDIILLMGE